MELYDAIFYRKSVRKYSNKKVTGQLMEEVKQISSDITYLNEELDIKAHVIDRGHLIHFLMGKKCKVKSPHYIVVTSTKGEGYLENIGFAVEEVVLQLTTLGLATCWLECELKRDDILEFTQLEELEELEEVESEENDDVEKNLEEPYAIIAFGYAEESQKLFRSEDDEIDRKNKKHVCKKIDEEYSDIIEAVRLSPSIKNSQPWVLYRDTDGFDIYEEKQKKNIMDMSKISMGIALRHLDIACKKHEITVRYENHDKKNKVGKKYYITTILK
ncbi:MAG: nitroreductase family protein [Peptostreptococcaceae bacterium]